MTHAARVHWCSSEARGRSGLPLTLRYEGLGRFPEDGDRWPDGAWGIELLFDVRPSRQGNGDVSVGRVQFLKENAPQARLAPGSRFSLYEGAVKVADVDVID